MKPSLPTPATFASIAIISPVSVRASTAANANVPTARAASIARGLDRLRGFARDALRELLVALLDAGATRRRGSRPAATRAAGRRRAPRFAACDRGVDLVRPALRDPAELAAVERRPDHHLLVGRDPVAADGEGVQFAHASMEPHRSRVPSRPAGPGHCGLAADTAPEELAGRSVSRSNRASIVETFAGRAK